MDVVVRLPRTMIAPLVAIGLALAGCGPNDDQPVAVVSTVPGVEVVDICPMLDPDTSADWCGSYQIVSLVEPGPIADRARSGSVEHGLNGDPVDGGRTFSGADGDVVSTAIGRDESDLFNPAGQRFVYQAWLTLSGNQIEALYQTEKPSWNVMQRGFADSAGGQWKLSLVTIDGEVQAQCVARDRSGEVLRAHSRHRFQPDVETAISCLLDDKSNELQIVVDRQAGDRDNQTDSGQMFGDVAPHDNGDDCWADVADQLFIGNKPICGTTPLTDDDRFQGVIRQVRVLKHAGQPMATEPAT